MLQVKFRHDNAIPGGLAQLGEHLLCKQGVVGSIPSSSTKQRKLLKIIAPQGAIIVGFTQYKSSLAKTAFVLIDPINRLFFKNS